MARIYVASSWRNMGHPGVVEFLRSLGHEVYDFRNPRTGGPFLHSTPTKGFAWSEIDPEWLGWTPERYRDLVRTHPKAAAGFAADYAAMRWADTCVLALPCGRSAHLEAGYFSDRPGKRLIILLDEVDFEPELMYLMANEIVTSWFGRGGLADVLGQQVAV